MEGQIGWRDRRGRLGGGEGRLTGRVIRAQRQRQARDHGAEVDQLVVHQTGRPAVSLE